ncbi:MAG: hypothetical protein VX874_21755 [Pseudomonadota bacterium]|nr:hypothetical protein [Pseudomonadota bacterium]
MNRFATMTAIALLAATPAATALAQDSAQAELNQDVYAMGMAELQGDGYDVNQVRQDNSGSLTFMATNETNGRILIMDEDGDIMSDTMTDLNAAAMIEADGDDDGGSLNAMADTDAMIDTETMSDDDSGSLSAGIGSDTNIGLDVEGDDGDGSASVDVGTGLDVGVGASGDDGDGSASVGVGADVGVGVSAEGSDGDDGGSASIGLDTGIDLGISADSES